jgi:hypothetical protein
MICIVSRFILAMTVTLFFAAFSQGQSVAVANKQSAIEKSPSKPYKILTSGKRITLQCKTNMKRVLVWTTTGHRIVEQHELDVPSFTFTVPVNEKYFFLMLETQDGKRYSEKFGVQ